MGVSISHIINFPITETVQYRLSIRLKDGKPVDFYECIKKDDVLQYGSNMNVVTCFVYTVRVVFNDGEEIIEEGNLEFFNSAYKIIKVSQWSRY